MFDWLVTAARSVWPTGTTDRLGDHILEGNTGAFIGSRVNVCEVVSDHIHPVAEL